MKNKYYNYFIDREINTLTEGCPLEDWVNNRPEGSCFAIHDSGFKIFLRSEEISLYDEYKDGDIYHFEENINSNFHNIRISATLELLKTVINPLNKVKILDFGCGEGIITHIINKEFPNYEISGFDYSISAIQKAHSRNKEIDFIVADAHNLPYSKNYFDIVIMNNIYEHLPDPVAVIIKVKEILQPEGLLIISTPNRYRANNIYNIITGKTISLMSNMHVTEYSIGQVKEQLEYAGYMLIKQISKALQDKGNSIKGILYYRLFIPLLKKYLGLCNSHHVLDNTIFYLAKVK